MNRRKRYIIALFVLLLPISQTSHAFDLGFESSWQPNTDGSGLFVAPFADARIFAYLPIEKIKLLLAFESMHRDSWHLFRGETGLIWIWGGPFYSEARASIGIDSDSQLHFRGYFDLFYEQPDYYVTTAIKGGLASSESAEDRGWYAQAMLGISIYPTGWPRIHTRVYTGYESENDYGQQQWTHTLSGWADFTLSRNLILLITSSLEYAVFPLGPSADVIFTIGGGPKIQVGENWNFQCSFEQEFPNQERGSYIRTALIGKIGS